MALTGNILGSLSVRNVGFVRDEIKWQMDRYDKIRDCLSGSEAVKKRRWKYLPQPDSADKSRENQDRYHEYLTRAVYYNATGRTLGGMVGEVFGRDPIIEVPPALDFLKKDASGTGVPLVQLAKRGLSRNLSYGRAGLFVDYPETGGTASKDDVESNGIRPSITLHNAWDVPNWRTDMRGAEEVITLAVLQEPYIASDDGFEIKTGTQYRVLRLRDSDGNISAKGFYTVEIWRRADGGVGSRLPLVHVAERVVIVNGEPSPLIPFRFLGSESNDTAVDNPPLYDLADMNIAHYRNSADYEDSLYVTGQPTPWFTGLTQQFVDKYYKDKTIRLGSRGAIHLPINGSAGLLQMAPNITAMEGMTHKERLMVALGAEIVQAKTVQRTATEANQEKASRSSVLSTCADNVSDAVTWALGFSCKFMGIEVDPDMKLALNTEFDLTNMSPQQITAVVQAWQSNAMSFSELRENFRRGGIATLDDDAAQAEIENELASNMGREVEQAGALAKAAAAAQPDPATQKPPVAK